MRSVRNLVQNMPISRFASYLPGIGASIRSPVGSPLQQSLNFVVAGGGYFGVKLPHEQHVGE